LLKNVSPRRRPESVDGNRSESIWEKELDQFLQELDVQLLIFDNIYILAGLDCRTGGDCCYWIKLRRKTQE